MAKKSVPCEGVKMVWGLIAIVLGSNGFWVLIQHFIIKKQDKKNIQNIATLAILHDRLYFLCEQYIVRGKIGFSEFDNLTYLYKPYEIMGGNGTGKDLYERCRALPRVKDIEVKK